MARLEEAYKTAREDRIDAGLQAGRHRELTAELDALVVDEPLRERLWGQRMIALYRSGRQADALRAYSELRTSLAENLGISPSTALQQLEVAMLCQDPMLELAPRWDLQSTPAPAVATVEPPRTRVNGDWSRAWRRRCPSSCNATLRTACSSDARPRCASSRRHGNEPPRAPRSVSSSPANLASGRRRSPVRWPATAHAAGGAVLLGRCDSDALTPYQPFVEALRRFVQTCSAGCLARQSQSDLREVGRLVPELAERMPGLTPLLPAEDADRFTLFEAVTSFLTTVATAHPLVVVLDDLHWADQPTCLLLAPPRAPGAAGPHPDPRHLP